MGWKGRSNYPPGVSGGEWQITGARPLRLTPRKRESEKIVGRCTLVEIRKEDGAQRYELDDGRIEWLTGWPRASNVKVGDTGVMVYRSTPSYGLHFFRKDE